MDSLLSSLFSGDCKTAVDIANLLISILSGIISALLILLTIAIKYVFGSYKKNNTFENEILHLRSELKVTQMLIDKEKT